MLYVMARLMGLKPISILVLIRFLIRHGASLHNVSTGVLFSAKKGSFIPLHTICGVNSVISTLELKTTRDYSTPMSDFKISRGPLSSSRKNGSKVKDLQLKVRQNRRSWQAGPSILENLKDTQPLTNCTSPLQIKVPCN